MQGLFWDFQEHNKIYYNVYALYENVPSCHKFYHIHCSLNQKIIKTRNFEDFEIQGSIFKALNLNFETQVVSRCMQTLGERQHEGSSHATNHLCSNFNIKMH